MPVETHSRYLLDDRCPAGLPFNYSYPPQNSSPPARLMVVWQVACYGNVVTRTRPAGRSCREVNNEGEQP